MRVIGVHQIRGSVDLCVYTGYPCVNCSHIDDDGLLYAVMVICMCYNFNMG